MSVVVLVLGVVSEGEVGGGEIMVRRGHSEYKLAVDVISRSPK